MARPSSPPILAQIRHSRSPAEQIIALRALKNDIIGHQQKKEMWVGLGVVEPIVRIMTSNMAQGKQSSKERYDHHFKPEPLSEKEMVRLQALCVIGSLAHGGPSFLIPLHNASVMPAILANTCPSSNPPQLVLSALRALSNIADSAALVSSSSPLNTSLLADSLFSRPRVGSLCTIISQSLTASVVQSQISLTAALISKLCRDERHQLNLVNAGVLDALATRLASIVISQGLVVPGAEQLAQKEGYVDYFPAPAPGNADLSGILEAIAVIIADSKFRASKLLYSNSLMAVFPASPLTEFQPNRSTKAAWGIFNASDLSTRQRLPSALDYLIPHVPLSRTKSSSALSSAFPPLGSGSAELVGQFGPSGVPSWSRSPNFEPDLISREPTSVEQAEVESPLIPYLIWLARSTKGLERLMAISVLTVLHRAGLTDKSRETMLGLLIVPILIQLLRENNAGLGNGTDTSITAAEQVLRDRKIKERTPAVLAMLIVDSEYLQKCAYDSGVISKLSDMIKNSYDPVLDSSQSRTWSPSTSNNSNLNTSGTSQASRFGQFSQPSLVHKIKVRESALRAIAALVPFKDEYRKALIDLGVVPYIVESLKSHPGKPSAKVSEKAEKAGQVVEDNTVISPGYGINPVSVLIAACGAVRHLSRSVSILRTTLIDNGVVMPVFALLRHPDIDVQISATAATCNLVMDFSPMRETITAAGVLKILCEHAHSGNVKLRLSALWALKHLVHSAGIDVKKSCLEELGQGWLVQLICDDTEDEALSSTKPGLGTRGFGEDADDDVQMDQLEDEDELRMGASIGNVGYGYNNLDTHSSFAGSRPAGSRKGSTPLTNMRLAALRDLETNPARRARKDDIAVQEQGLDFIRNLIGGFNNVGISETSEMIDFLLIALGQDRIFEILASKLKFKAINQFSKPRIVPPQAEIIAAVEYILVHMAASIPRHRQLVIAQTDLLKLLIPQFAHPSKEVRLALCWIVINLTWVDDAQDGQACVQRAQELKKLGFLPKLEQLEHDMELDIRERARIAVWQMKQGY